MSVCVSVGVLAETRRRRRRRRNEKGTSVFCIKANVVLHLCVHKMKGSRRRESDEGYDRPTDRPTDSECSLLLPGVNK